MSSHRKSNMIGLLRLIYFPENARPHTETPLIIMAVMRSSALQCCTRPSHILLECRLPASGPCMSHASGGQPIDVLLPATPPACNLATCSPTPPPLNDPAACGLTTCSLRPCILVACNLHIIVAWTGPDRARSCGRLRPQAKCRRS